MNMLDLHADAHCQQGPLCTGPGCRRNTGKTARNVDNGSALKHMNNAISFANEQRARANGTFNPGGKR